MNRRKALKLFGSIFVCIAGSRALALGSKGTEGGVDFQRQKPRGKMNYEFDEAAIGDIIIKRVNGTKLVVPFTDICEALEAT